MKKNGCDENLEFKKYFYCQMTYVEKWTFGYIIDSKLRNYDTSSDMSVDGFLKSLHFISQYAPVSYSNVGQYQVRYNDSDIYEADKKGWLKWYDDHKCDNLQLPK